MELQEALQNASSICERGRRLVPLFCSFMFIRSNHDGNLITFVDTPMCRVLKFPNQVKSNQVERNHRSHIWTIWTIQWSLVCYYEEAIKPDGCILFQAFG